ncbi:hypothetical protein BD560DRAFT_384466 [Blakeslea trispora]|nr:hypothetical protein BD560DRAFT_384466 [Blakeslea trispora]
MSNQSNSITLSDVQFMVQRQIMNESLNILEKLGKIADTVDSLKEGISSIREENKLLKEEILLLKDGIHALQSSSGNVRSAPALTPENQAILNIQNNGLFRDHLYPIRNVTKKMVMASHHFSWDSYHKLAEIVLGKTIPRDEFEASCKESVNKCVVNTVMYTIKKKYGLLKTNRNFAKLPSDICAEAEILLERKAAPFMPLAACTGRWGARMILMRMWHRASQHYNYDREDYEEKKEGQEEDEHDGEEFEEDFEEDFEEEGGQRTDPEQDRTDFKVLPTVLVCSNTDSSIAESSLINRTGGTSY